ncbi:MAG: hypothetical protein U0359_41975 [Byssovorax sp.]
MNRMPFAPLRRAGLGAALCVFALGALTLAACEDKPAPTIAPASSALTAAKPASMGAVKALVNRATSKVELVMDAPQEKIRGRAKASTDGELSIDLDDITKSTGLITVDISDLEIFQSKADDSGKFGEEVKNETQNKHAKTWLEISDDTPEDVRKQNSKVQFSIKSIEIAGEKSVAAMSGGDRTMTFSATGDFLLHGHKATKKIDLMAVFHMEGGKLASVMVKTSKPVPVDLAEFDVKPRDGFGKLAAKTLDILAPKVNKEALVTIEFTAAAGGAAAPAKAP